MLKKLSAFLSLLALVACNDLAQVSKESAVIAGVIASDICAGKVIGGVTGTANCSGGSVASTTPIAGKFYIFSSRSDTASLPTTNNFLDLDFLTGREVATLQNAFDGSPLYLNNYSVIPFPLDESDGRYAPCFYAPGSVCDYSDLPEYKAKRHYLETIMAAKIVKDGGTFNSRQDSMSVCGSSGNVEARIADCKTVNGDWSFYNGAQYGQVGEGDWSLVSVVDDSGVKYEVWRDERTKLIWSDRASNQYNWYQASGYSKPSAISTRETQYSSEPGFFENTPPFSLNQTLQPINPISVCPDVVAGQIAAGGGHYTTYAPNPETAFKGNLSIANNVVWKLPSIDDFKLADVNGIRKVLPEMDYNFWSSSSYSFYRYHAFRFSGAHGVIGYDGRYWQYSVRCVGFERE